jgi:hypothetical protein
MATRIETEPEQEGKNIKDKPRWCAYALNWQLAE